MKSIDDVAREAQERAAAERMQSALQHTTAAQLRDEALARMDLAYREATTRREKCSREDFAAGFVAALILYGHGDLFRAVAK